MKGEGERVGGWTIIKCVYINSNEKKKKQQKTNKKNTELNTENCFFFVLYFFVFHQSSFSIISWKEINITLFGIL